MNMLPYYGGGGGSRQSIYLSIQEVKIYMLSFCGKKIECPCFDIVLKISTTCWQRFILENVFGEISCMQLAKYLNVFNC